MFALSLNLMLVGIVLWVQDCTTPTLLLFTTACSSKCVVLMALAMISRYCCLFFRFYIWISHTVFHSLTHIHLFICMPVCVRERENVGLCTCLYTQAHFTCLNIPVTEVFKIVLLYDYIAMILEYFYEILQEKQGTMFTLIDSFNRERLGLM